MYIIALDDEYLGLEGLVSAIQQVAPNDELKAYREAEAALADATVQSPDVAFLDIELRDGNGLDLARKLKELNPKINIIFVTGFSDYMKEAFDMYASGYIFKPVLAEKIKCELNNLRYPVEDKKRITVRAFGTFDILGDGLPLKFSYSKSKELLAILVDSHGLTCSMSMVEKLLWENEDDCRDRRAYIRNLIADIRRSLRKYDSEDLILRSHNNISLDVSKIQCDYLDFLSGNAEALASFKGEYMSQYTWAKKTRTELKKQKRQ